MSVNLLDFTKHSKNHIGLLNKFVFNLKQIKALTKNHNNFDELDDLLAEKNALHARLNESFAWQEQLEKDLSDDVLDSADLTLIKSEIERLSTEIYDEATELAYLFKVRKDELQALIKKTNIKPNLPQKPYANNSRGKLDITC